MAMYVYYSKVLNTYVSRLGKTKAGKMYEIDCTRLLQDTQGRLKTWGASIGGKKETS